MAYKKTYDENSLISWITSNAPAKHVLGNNNNSRSVFSAALLRPNKNRPNLDIYSTKDPRDITNRNHLEDFNKEPPDMSTKSSKPEPEHDSSLANGLPIRDTPGNINGYALVKDDQCVILEQKFSNGSTCVTSELKTMEQELTLTNQQTIPTIHLDPPPSVSDNKTLTSSEELLSNLSAQIGLQQLLSPNFLGLERQRHDIKTSDGRLSPLPTPTNPVDNNMLVTLPCRYQRQLQSISVDTGDVETEDIKEGSDDDMCQREEDLSTALKWIRQEILEMKEQDKSLLRQFLELRASILQLRCCYDLDLQGSCSDVSSVDSGSTYSLYEPGLAYSNSNSSINNIHFHSNSINTNSTSSSSNCNVLKSPHQLRRMMLLGGELGAMGGRCGGGGGPQAGMVSLSLPNSPRVARLRWRSDEII